MEVTFILQKRWEDEEGNIHALRVATGIERIMKDATEWKNGYQVKLHYGDITGEDFYKEYMGLKTTDSDSCRPDKERIARALGLRHNPRRRRVVARRSDDSFGRKV